jgi:rhodanese-related sulfurtransferase
MSSRRALVSFGSLQAALAVALLAGLWLAWPAWRLGTITEQVRKRYPGVPQFSSADLSGWLADTTKSKPLILDVRTEPEYAVSHLVGAIRVDPGAELSTLDLPEDHRRVIIAVCTTGERAAAFATRLQESGYSRIFNLEGGIIRWANEGRPLTDGHRLVTHVQPADDSQIALLKKVHRAAPVATP